MFSMTGKVYELLLRDNILDLQKAIDICRAQELKCKQTKEMAETHIIDKVTASGQKSVGETGGSQHSQDIGDTWGSRRPQDLESSWC